MALIDKETIRAEIERRLSHIEISDIRFPEKVEVEVVLKQLLAFLDTLTEQPAWKPSEEQMEELGKAKDMYMKSSSGIASLYYDLITKFK